MLSGAEHGTDERPETGEEDADAADQVNICNTFVLVAIVDRISDVNRRREGQAVLACEKRGLEEHLAVLWTEINTEAFPEDSRELGSIDDWRGVKVGEHARSDTNDSMVVFVVVRSDQAVVEGSIRFEHLPALQTVAYSTLSGTRCGTSCAPMSPVAAIVTSGRGTGGDEDADGVENGEVEGRTTQRRREAGGEAKVARGKV